MGRIYRRETLVKSDVPKKKKDEKRRTRNECINFHVSHEERTLIEERIKLSGKSRREFFLESCLNQSINVQGNVKSFNAINNAMQEIMEQIDKGVKLDELEGYQLELVITILDILHSFYST